MKPILLPLTVVLLFSACGFKGELYLPKENDKQKFGVIQTGIGINDDEQQTPEVVAPNSK